jgi:hypothetical protein
MAQDNYGYFGPSYSFADNIPLPGQVGVHQDGSISGILGSIGGLNYYLDTIAFGSPTFFDTNNPQPMGIRYYMNTEMRCSNGATMSEFYDGVTRGDSLGTLMQDALASAGLPPLRGLAPGMLENAEDALDPRPILSAVTGTGYPVCQQVQCPVGDVNGSITDAQTGAPYLVDPVQYVNGMPYQTRWVQANDSTGSPITITKDEFGATPQCYNSDGTYQTNPPAGCPTTEPAATSTQGTGDFALCTVTQPAQMPPSLQPTSESFVGRDGGAEAERTIALTIVAGLGLVGLWAWTRK